MARAALGVAALSLSSCSGEAWLPPEWSRAAYDAAYERATGFASHQRCHTVERDPSGSSYFSSMPSRQCFSFFAPRIYAGIFVQEFEGNRFIEGAKPARRYVPADKVWMEIDERSDLRRTPLVDAKSGSSRIWAIRFVGRKTDKWARSGYGHFGMSDALILVDRTISAKLLASYGSYVPDDVLVR